MSGLLLITNNFDSNCGRIKSASAPVFTLLFSILCSGCSTTLGYLPEVPKPTSTTEDDSQAPDYKTVRKWTNDLIDGYSSRAAMNRHADSAGAVVAGTGAAALVGLATFGAGSGWIKGVPIGSAFLGGLFGIYANETRGIVYGAAANYLQTLLIASDTRYDLLTHEPSKSTDTGATARSPTPNEAVKSIRDRLVTEKDQLVSDNLKENMQMGVYALKVSTSPLNSAEQTAATASQKAAQANIDANNERIQHLDERLTSLQDFEGLISMASAIDLKNIAKACLWADTLEVKKHVDNLIDSVAPSDVSTSLKNVGSSTGKANGDWISARTIADDNPDLLFFKEPVKSKCGTLLN